MTDSASSGPTAGAAATTRARLMASAITEFAEHGFAGARVDRIVEGAEVNKRMLYAHFGSKEGLFDAVVDSTIDALLDQVPFNAGNLSYYATAYFDQLVSNPEALRLTVWRAVEQMPPSDGELQSYAQKVQAIRLAQLDGAIVQDLPAVDVLAMLFSLTRSWLTATPALRAQSGDEDGGQRLAEHRKALATAVERLLMPDR